MRRNWPITGDKALVVPDRRSTEIPELDWAVVNVLTDPFKYGDLWVSRVECASWDYAVHPTRSLIRIPPDSEAKALFQDEPIEADVGVGK